MPTAKRIPAVILFAHGAADPRWAEPFARMLDRVRERSPQSDAMLAFLERMQPDLPSAIAAQVGRGHAAIRIVPVFLGPGGHLRVDLPAIVAEAKRIHAGVAIDVLPPVGDDEGVIAAIAAYAIRGGGAGN